ncbi:unnamed protein product [Pleuronectes platessa]|uniref:Uncharacterized protein n=1 Tax=Pleuronectes platessa TaxID=8262 RepID=A0A9N7VGP7_PLEPL|nr:unnamed protein product [Pleuronectes platessa]
MDRKTQALGIERFTDMWSSGARRFLSAHFTEAGSGLAERSEMKIWRNPERLHEHEETSDNTEQSSESPRALDVTMLPRGRSEVSRQLCAMPGTSGTNGLMPDTPPVTATAKLRSRLSSSDSFTRRQGATCACLFQQDSDFTRSSQPVPPAPVPTRTSRPSPPPPHTHTHVTPSHPNTITPPTHPSPCHWSQLETPQHSRFSAIPSQ